MPDPYMFLDPRFLPAEEAPEEEEKSERPSWALPTALAGGLGLGAAHALGSDAHFDLIRKTLREDTLPLAPHETALTRYSTSMSPGAGTRLGGILPVGEVITRLRSNPRVMKMMGMTPDVMVNTLSEAQEGRAHYDQFSKGPLSAYWHQLIKLGDDVPVDEQLAASLGVNKPMSYRELMLPRLEEFWKSQMENAENAPADRGPTKWLLPYELDTQYMPHDKQVELMKRFAEQLPPEILAERNRVENDILGSHLREHQKNYMPTYNSVTKTRELLKTLGLTAGGAGLGGLAGNYLYGQLKDEDEQSRSGRGWATAAGTGLGGLGGYLLSHPGQKFLNGLFRKSSKLTPLSNTMHTSISINPRLHPRLSSLMQKAANRDVGALLGALLGGGAGAWAHKNTVDGRLRTAWAGAKGGQGLAALGNLLTPRPAFMEDPVGNLGDAMKDGDRTSRFVTRGFEAGAGVPGGVAAGGLGAGLGGLAGHFIGRGLESDETRVRKNTEREKKKDKKESDSKKEASCGLTPMQLAHAALVVADLRGFGLEKQAEAVMLGSRRIDLSPEEEAEIAQAKKKVIPKLFPTLKDPTHAHMASPAWAAILNGLLGAGVGGLYGAGIGGVAAGGGPAERKGGMLTGGLLGAGLGGLGLGALGYKLRDNRNDDLEEMIRRPIMSASGEHVGSGRLSASMY